MKNSKPKNQMNTDRPRRSTVVSAPSSVIKVERFSLTDEEKRGLSLKGRLSDIWEEETETKKAA